MQLVGARVLVTGATGGLGRGVVPELLTRGAQVLATFRSEEKLTSLMEQCEGAEAPMLSFPCDVTDKGQVTGLARRIAESGPLDAVVCLAGGWSGGHTLWQGPPDELESQLRLNVVSAYNVIHEFLPEMVARGSGRIVTIGSRIAVAGRKNNAAAAASKAALITLTEAVADELKGTGVAAYCLMPSIIDSEANRLAMPRGNFARWVTPRRIGAVIAWLLSDEAAVMNGAVIPVYGDA